MTPGTVNWQPDEVNHPILKGLPSPWNTSDEWYLMNRNVEAVPGFRVLAKVTVTNSSKGTTPRPAVWVTENANGKGGRSFYTIKGHNQSALRGTAVPRPDAARDPLVGSPPARRQLGLAFDLAVRRLSRFARLHPAVRPVFVVLHAFPIRRPTSNGEITE